MKDIKALSNTVATSTPMYVFLAIITAGIYPYMLLSNKHDEFRKIMGFELFQMELLRNVAIAAGVCGIFMGFFPPLVFVSWGFWIYFGFTMRGTLKRYCEESFNFEVKVNAVLTFLFGIYYINYVMNTLDARLAKYQNENGIVAVSSDDGQALPKSDDANSQK